MALAKKHQRHKNATIKKLFENLRNESSLSDCSVITINDCSPNPVLRTELKSVQSGTLKRNLDMTDIDVCSSKSVKLNNVETIVIKDEENTVSNDYEIVTPKKSKNNIPLTSTPYKDSTNNKEPNSNINNNLDCIDNLNVTRIINNDSYLTIDLTNEAWSTANSTPNTVIEVDNLDDTDCKLVSVSQANSNTSATSNDSIVTVLNKPSLQFRKIKKGIAKLNPMEKGKLLDLITQNIFRGCDVKKVIGEVKDEEPNMQTSVQTETDTYIKEVIVGQVTKNASRNSIGSNIYHPDRHKPKTGLRMIVIDGSNVAMEHGRGQFFSVKGLEICIDYFLQRGHEVKAFVPRFRCKFGKSTEPRRLDSLERAGLVIYTPSREIQGRMITSYDDRYIIQTAAEFDGVIVSGDNYRDLINENPRWKFVIQNRVLPFTWVGDMIMFPKDPFGRYGPSLQQLLTHPPATQQPAT